MSKQFAALLAGALCTAVAAWPGASAPPTAAATLHYDLRAQPLGAALQQVGRITGAEILFLPSDVDGLTAPALRGDYGLAQALDRLLAGTALIADMSHGSAIIRRHPPAGAGGPGTSEIVVTGSRIRGAPTASPVIRVTRQQMRDAGQNSLTDVVRDIPQNFGGGQNPGIGLTVPADNGSNVGGASTINLRGIGNAATLTLLNGHRLAYDLAANAIDISAIPVAALDRIEVVPDGSSALYGSDAVAGVVNILLRPDFDGIETSARLGASTDGGNRQQQYDLVAGTRWSSGGVIAVADYLHATGIWARQRDYAADRSPGLLLYPPLEHVSLMLSGHQALGSHLRFSIDTLYNRRTSTTAYPTTSAGEPFVNGGAAPTRSLSYAATPSLRLSLGGWDIALDGVYARDLTHYQNLAFVGRDRIVLARGCYCNVASSAELSGNGPLVRLPGGMAKLAVGIGERTDGLNAVRSIGTAQDIHVSQNADYAFGELDLPLISPDQHLPAMARLNLSAALRYENYPGIDHVLTPRLGLIYAPVPDLDLKLSWGHSFRAPTLYELYGSVGTTVSTAAARGGTAYPSTATVLTRNGGNPALKPERAVTWTATASLHPRALPGAQLDISYFHIAYSNRIIAPISVLARALSDPAYAGFVQYDPSDAAKAEAVAAGIFSNILGRPYDPSQVVAIVDDRDANVERQLLHGVDIAVRYAFAPGPRDHVELTGSGTWLHSSQSFGSDQPALALAGRLFSPPHLRGRAGISWTRDTLTLSGFANYTGGVVDTRLLPPAHVPAMTTGDLTLRYRLAGGTGLARNLEFALSVQNLTNARPGAIRTIAPYDPPYDTTNYLPFGRVVSLEIAKKW